MGNHWSMCVYDFVENTLTYGDSLSWNVPDGLLEKCEVYVRHVYPENSQKPNLEHVTIIH